MFFAENASNFNPKRKPKKTSDNDALGDSKSSPNPLNFSVFPSGNTKLHQKSDFLGGLLFY